MRIILIGKDYYPTTGGMEQHLLELARGLHKLGHSVCVLNLRTSSNTGLPNEEFQQIQEFFPITKNPITYFRYIKRMMSILSTLDREEKIDVIHWHDLIAGMAVRLWSKGKSVLKIFTNHSSGYLRWRKNVFAKGYFSCSVNHAHAIIGPSQELVECSTRDFKNVSKIMYIPNGVDTERFSESGDDRQKKILNIDGKRKIIFCPRRLSPKNGVSFLAQAIASIVKEYSNAYFLITGKGEPLEEELKIKKIIQESNMESHVLFLGDVKNSDMPELYQISDVVVIPSLMEAVSLSALEAMASAKPIVASDVGGLTQLFSHGDIGVLVPPANPQAIADSVSTLLQNDDLRKQIGTKARAHVQLNYSWEFVSKKTEGLYKSSFT